MSRGSPWCLNTCRRYRFAVSSAVTWTVVGMKCAIFVNRLTQTYTASKPWDFGSSTIKSMETDDQGAGGIGSGCSWPWGCWRGVLFRQQVSQELTYSLTNWRIRGQW